MLGLLADANCDGHLELLLRICRNERWRELWAAARVRVCSFADLGAPVDLNDADLWELCQREEILLITNNRNDDGDNSLQATIRNQSTVHSLPVLTFGDADRVLADPEYAERAVIRLLEILLDVDSVRGTGRLFLPAEPS